ncbi:ABC transporter ATP-binding protein [Lutispora sp.]|uniref:ABC transporter ATP-binding protein n=1 Tax=Lutispora sp. TaxID=2828727 RepID=UPI000EE00E56|nr:ABC transporter ATP-binding protein [Lutispora sp.]MEA4960665.1 ABC transporter ATP-binding protein [Lutispora sp.]HCJ57377.1 hypothetical protein [Clostridiaceae bacterium]
MKRTDNEGFKLIKKNFKRLRPYQIAVYILALITIILSLALVNMMQGIVDRLAIGHSVKDGLFPLLVTCISYFAFVAVFQFLFRRTQMVGRNEILVLLYNNLQKKELSFFKKHNSGEIVSLINNEGREVGDWISFGVLGLFNLFTVLIMNIGLMFYYNWILALIVCSMILIVYFSTQSIASSISKLSAASYEMTSKVNSFLLETLKSEKLIHILNKHKWFTSRFSSLVYEERYPLDRKRADYHAIYMTMFLFLSVLLPIITVLIGASISKGNNISVGELLAFYALTAHIQEPVQYIPDFLSQRKNAIKLAEHLLPIMEDVDIEQDTLSTLPPKVDSLSVDIAYFSYEKSEEKLLENVKFCVKSDELLLIKGNSGSGKTTLVDIIMGFENSDLAQVFLKDVDCSKIAHRDRWNHILLVGQESLLIEGTLKENLNLGDNFSDELIGEALYTACLEEFMDTKKLNQIIKGQADGVSGGQKQRICLARILLRKPDILILDEPTSSLDSSTSETLAQRVTDFAKKYSIIVLVVSHKSEFDKYATRYIEVKADNICV